MDVGIISVILWAFALIGMVWGLIRGWKNSVIRLVEVVVCAFVAYFLASSLAEAVLALDLSSYGLSVAGVNVTTIEETMTTLISSVEIISGIVNASPTISSLITIFPVVIISLVSFVILFFLIKYFVGIFHAIIGGIIRRRKKKQSAYDEDDNAKKRTLSRLIGAGIGVLQGIICFAVVFMPIAGVTFFLEEEVKYIREYQEGVVTENTATASVYASQGDEQSSPMAVAEETLSSINRKFNLLRAFGYKSTSMGVVKGLTSFELNGVKTSLISEADNVVKIYVRVDDLLDTPIDKWTSTDTELAKETVDLFFDSPITGDITIELLQSMAENWTSEDPSEQFFAGMAKPTMQSDGVVVFDVFLNQIKSDTKEEIKGELHAVVDVLNVALKYDVINVVKTSTTIDNVILPLSEDKFAEEIIGAMVGGRAMRNTLPSVVQYGLDQMYPMLGVSEEVYSDLKITKASSEINWDTEKVYLGNVFSGLAKTYLSLEQEGEVLEKLDYKSLAKALENIRKSELLNSRLVNGNTLSKEITLALLNSEHLQSLDGMERVLNEVESDYANVNFENLLGTLKASVNLAQSMQDLNKGEIDELPDSQVADLLLGLTDDKTGKLVKDLTTYDNLNELGVEENTALAIGSLMTSLIDYNSEVNSSGGGAETMPTDENGIGQATDAFKELSEVVQTGIDQGDSAEYKFFKSKAEMKEFILSLQSSPYMYSVTLASSTTLGFTDELGYTKLTDNEYGYLEELISEDPERFNESEMKTLFGVQLIG